MSVLVAILTGPGPGARQSAEPPSASTPPRTTAPPDVRSTPARPPLTPRSAPPPPPTVTTTTATTSRPASRVGVRFQGDLTVGFVDNGLQDIDPQPPATVEHDGRGDVWFTTNGNMLFAVDGARIAEWTGTAGLPDFQTCRERTKTGSTEFSLHPGDILCVRTSEFRTARLVTKVLADPPVPGNLPTFNATVWEPATR